MQYILDNTISFGLKKLNNEMFKKQMKNFFKCCCNVKGISMIDIGINDTYLISDELYQYKTKFSISCEWQEFRNRIVSNVDLRQASIIRIFCNKEETDEVLEYINSLPPKKCEIFLCPRNIYSFSDTEILDLSKKINKCNISALYICYECANFTAKDLMRYFLILDSNLDENIKIGLHFEMTFSLGFDKIEKLCNTTSKRDIIIDATMLGVGEEKAFLNTELILENMNYYYEETALIDSMEIIWSLIHPALSRGYSPLSFLEAKTRTNSEYFEYFLTKGLHLSEMKGIVNLIDDSYFRYEFDKKYADKLLNDWKSKKNCSCL